MEKYYVMGASIYEHEYTDDENMERLDKFCAHLDAHGIDASSDFLCEFCGEWRKSGKAYFCDVNEMLDALAIKDGVDFVIFEDGTPGAVAYYNGRRDAVKVLRNVNEEDEEAYYYGATDEDRKEVEICKTLFCDDDETFCSYEECAKYYEKMGYKVV